MKQNHQQLCEVTKRPCHDSKGVAKGHCKSELRSRQQSVHKCRHCNKWHCGDKP